LAEMHLHNLLPTSTISQLMPWFDAARAVIDSHASNLSSWPGKLRVLPTRFNSIAPRIKPDVQASVYEALLLERQLEITYRAIAGAEETKTYPAHPLALVVRPPVVYLACTARDYTEPRFLAMCRIERAHLLEQVASRPAQFDVDEMISRQFGMRLSNKPINLVLKVRSLLRRYLEEAPVAGEQMVRVIDAEWAELRARVVDSVLLRSWLRSLGSEAVVMEPARLRDDMRAEAARLIDLYGAA
jgi:predicted DNA-binding transcriptional regulator YafY